MKVLTFSRHFPKKHPKAGQPTWFVEKVMACLADRIPDWTMKDNFVLYDWHTYYNCTMPKGHTIRAGSRFKPGDMASLRIWSDKPYRSKQIEFAQVEVKKTWEVIVYASEFILEVKINDALQDKEGQEQVALNDGLNLIDFYNWFKIHPKKKELLFAGQIICWSNTIEYKPTSITPAEVNERLK